MGTTQFKDILECKVQCDAEDECIGWGVDSKWTCTFYKQGGAGSGLGVVQADSHHVCFERTTPPPDRPQYFTTVPLGGACTKASECEGFVTRPIPGATSIGCVAQGTRRVCSQLLSQGETCQSSKECSVLQNGKRMVCDLSSTTGSGTCVSGRNAERPVMTGSTARRRLQESFYTNPFNDTTCDTVRIEYTMTAPENYYLSLEGVGFQYNILDNLVQEVYGQGNVEAWFSTPSSCTGSGPYGANNLIVRMASSKSTWEVPDGSDAFYSCNLVANTPLTFNIKLSNFRDYFADRVSIAWGKRIEFAREIRAFAESTSSPGSCNRELVVEYPTRVDPSKRDFLDLVDLPEVRMYSQRDNNDLTVIISKSDDYRDLSGITSNDILRQRLLEATDLEVQNVEMLHSLEPVTYNRSIREITIFDTQNPTTDQLDTSGYDLVGNQVVKVNKQIQGWLTRMPAIKLALSNEVPFDAVTIRTNADFFNRTVDVFQRGIRVATNMFMPDVRNELHSFFGDRTDITLFINPSEVEWGRGVGRSIFEWNERGCVHGGRILHVFTNCVMLKVARA